MTSESGASEATDDELDAGATRFDDDEWVDGRVMLDTTLPLQPTAAALMVEDAGYHESFI